MTKAVILELVNDLCANTFIAALRNIISHQGHIVDIYSDNGTNFVAKKYNCAVEIYLQEGEEGKFISISQLGITSLSPHFKDFWGAAVRSTK